MILLKTTQLINTFQIYMMIFIFVGITVWICAHVTNRIRAKGIRMEKEIKRQLRIVEPMDSVVANKQTTVFKN